MEKRGRTTELLEVTKRVDGSIMGIPVIKITGEKSGPTLLLVGGVHGDEPEGIKAVLNITNQLDAADLRGTVIGIPVVNVPAYTARRRGNPLDEWYYDLNRIFPGSSSGSLTQRFANKLITEVVPGANLLVALHSGGNNCYCSKRTVIPNDSEDHMRLAKAFGPGWEFIAVGAGERKEIADLTAIAAQKGVTSIMLEIGGSCDRLPDRFDETVDAIVSAIYNVMREYNMIEGKPVYSKEYILMEYEPLRNSHGGLVVFKKAFRPGTEVKKGEELLEIVDLFGNTLEVIKMPYDGIIVLIPGQVVLPFGGCQISSIGRIIRRIKSKA